MKKIILGKTGLKVTKTSFGALPIQRTDFINAEKILLRAYESGINYFDTARSYTDSEEKLGKFLGRYRNNIIISTKSNAKDLEKLKLDLDECLKQLKTDYIDIFQLHNPKTWPLKKDHDEILLFLENAKKEGKIRHIGVTNHSIEIAEKTVLSGFFETLQFPFNLLSSDKDLRLVEICKENNIGFIAMKALSGGLITDIECAFSFFTQYDNVVPIWGIQRLDELDQFLELDKKPPLFNKKMKEKISKHKKELSGDFCRGCGYCLPCPVNIEINMSARMSLVLRRLPFQKYITKEWQEKMSRIKNCIDCKACLSRCPYNLNVPELLKKNLLDYEEFIKIN